MKTWAISDIHGCFHSFLSLLNKMDFTFEDKLFVLGDIIDRWPYSRELVDYLMSMKNCTPLMGNHEEMMLSCLENDKYFYLWCSVGGQETLESFNVGHPCELDEKYINWFGELHIYVTYGKHVLSHAGVDLNQPYPFKMTDEKREYILWNRDVQRDFSGKYILVIGHTPLDVELIKDSMEEEVICIDGGCVFDGQLVAFCLDTHELLSVPLHEYDIPKNV